MPFILTNGCFRILWNDNHIHNIEQLLFSRKQLPIYHCYLYIEHSFTSTNFTCNVNSEIFNSQKPNSNNTAFTVSRRHGFHFNIFVL